MLAGPPGAFAVGGAIALGQAASARSEQGSSGGDRDNCACLIGAMYFCTVASAIATPLIWTMPLWNCTNFGLICVPGVYSGDSCGIGDSCCGENPDPSPDPTLYYMFAGAMTMAGGPADFFCLKAIYNLLCEKCPMDYPSVRRNHVVASANDAAAPLSDSTGDRANSSSSLLSDDADNRANSSFIANNRHGLLQASRVQPRDRAVHFVNQENAMH